jgi:hypothetical protein
MLKIIFKKQKKYYFDALPSEKHFEKQSQPYSQTEKKKLKEKRERGARTLHSHPLFFKKKKKKKDN